MQNDLKKIQNFKIQVYLDHSNNYEDFINENLLLHIIYISFIYKDFLMYLQVVY